MNRRELFISAAATASALCGSQIGGAIAEGAVSNDTPVMALFRQWQEAFRLGNDLSNSVEASEAWGSRMSEIEDEMLSIPSQTMGDVAAKIAAWTSFGDFTLSDTSDQRIWDEIKALVGVAT